MFLKIFTGVVIVCAGLFAASVVLFGMKDRWSISARLAACCVIVCAVAGFIFIVSGAKIGDERDALANAAADQGFPFPQPVGAGYVTSDSCRSCHPDEHASWHRTFHRTMTQVASPEVVVAPFDNVPLNVDGMTATLERRGDEFWVDMVDPQWERMMYEEGRDASRVANPPRTEARIVMTTGSHHFQVYWFRSKEGRELWQFPWRWHIAEQRWVHRRDVFLWPPQWEPGMQIQVWNRNCILCHSTGGQPGWNEFTGHMDNTEVAELGIACESCHGPAKAHVQLMKRRAEGENVAAGDDFAIVNPAKLPHELSSQVCGRCHSHFQHTNEDLMYVGPSHRPGDELSEHGYLLDVSQQRGEQRRFWADGANCSGGREFNGLIGSACFTQGTISCLSCHSMHNSDPDDQLAADMHDNRACYQCHESYRDNLQQHTHHAADSSGSSCFNCHMPYTSFALLKAIRNHQIDSPRVRTIVSNSRPNACNLCHLDKTLRWTADHLADWYGQPQPELAVDEEQIAASLLWLLRGDAAQRAFAAWHIGWQPAHEASGSDWIAPFVARLLEDPYSAVRWIAYESLRKLPGFASFQYEFEATDEQLAREGQRAIQQWLNESVSLSHEKTGSPRHGAHLLLDGPKQLQTDAIDTLLNRRDDQPVEIVE